MKRVSVAVRVQSLSSKIDGDVPLASRYETTVCTQFPICLRTDLSATPATLLSCPCVSVLAVFSNVAIFYLQTWNKLVIFFLFLSISPSFAALSRSHFP